MMSPNELRKNYPELRKYSDDELRSIERDLQTAAELAVEWWIEQRVGSSKIPFGLLKSSSNQEYNEEEDK